MFNFRTDLASERREIYQKANKLDEIDGVEANQEEINDTIKVERVKITNENGEKALGKPMGSYITIDIKRLKLAQEEELQKAGEVLTNELKQVIGNHIDSQGEILVVGLGNIYVTPDALGPKVINEIEVTRHIINYLPQYIEEAFGGKLEWNEEITVPFFPIVLWITSIFISITGKKEIIWENWEKLLLIGIIATTIFVLFTSMFIAWSATDLTIIQGIQGRYFLPIMPLLYLVFGRKFLEDNRTTKHIALIGVTMQIVVILEIFLFHI